MGHVFVVQGDLRTLHCDHWLLPVDVGLNASRSWNRSEPWLRIRDTLPARMEPDQRVVQVPWDGPRRPWPTNVASGSRAPASWQAESVLAFLAAAAAAPRTLPDRDRPLLALPLVGTGFGGKRLRAGEVLQAILPAIYRFVVEQDVDVVLVTWREEDLAAAQAARRACQQQGLQVWPVELHPELQRNARELALRAAQSRLVVFMGAGVSASAGLPTWGQLLDQLATQAGFTELERIGLRELGHLDRAQLIGTRLGSPQALGEAIRASLDVGDTVALSHVLLAALPVREFITTNYDDCFERACASVGREVARLPYAPASRASRWLLKMHGCVTAPEDIVLTRQDYVRYAERSAALAGIVQAMLITRHMLFVGFSLDDDNFHRIVDAVRRALSGAERDLLGSVVSLFANPLVEQLWGDDLLWVHLDDAPRSEERARALARAGRRFELFWTASPSTPPPPITSSTTATRRCCRRGSGSCERCWSPCAPGSRPIPGPTRTTRWPRPGPCSARCCSSSATGSRQQVPRRRRAIRTGRRRRPSSGPCPPPPGQRTPRSPAAPAP